MAELALPEGERRTEARPIGLTCWTENVPRISSRGHQRLERIIRMTYECISVVSCHGDNISQMALIKQAKENEI
jgi:hypothetical protein